MKISAAGDFLAQQRIAHDKGMEDIKAFMAGSDASFVNIETTLFKEGTSGIWGNSFSGGSYLHADPAVLDDVKAYGFDLVTYANNHAFDFAQEGFLQTRKAVMEAGLASSGAGLDMYEAARPAFVGKVALVSVCSSYVNDTAIAGFPSPSYPGRPGINALRVAEKIVVDKQQFRTLQEIAKESGINTAQEISRKEGYTPPEKEGELTLNRKIIFVEGDKPGVKSELNKTDMARICASIAEARNKANVVLVSIHSHASSGGDKSETPDHLVEFAHQCIDSGADAVIGHGPHVLRAIEIYKGKPVFHSLGDFVLQCESATTAPAEFYTKVGVSPDRPLKEAFDKRSNHGKRGLQHEAKYSRSVVASFGFSNGKLDFVDLLPIELGFGKPERQGCPAPAPGIGIIRELATLSAKLGTKIIEDESGIGHVVLGD